MIEFNDFIKEVNKKFQDELWADFESKFFGDDLFIKVGIDFSYGHQFELYIQNARMNKSIEEWTVDLKRNQIIYLKDKEIYFITDADEKIMVKGERYFVNVLTTIYYLNPSDSLKNYIINPELMNFPTVSNVTVNNYFEELRL
jgi:hypothetical protein